MTKQELTKAIKEMALNLGADMVGIAPVSRYEGAPHMLKPQAHLPEAKSVICLGIHHPDASVDWCGEPNPNYPAAFQIGMIPKLDAVCYRISRYLEKEGYATIPQPCTTYWRHRYYKDIPFEHAASWSHMSAFVACGLGEYGYHGMVLSPKYGPRVRIISFITSAELESDPLYDGPPLCDGCKACARHCIGRNYSQERLNEPNFIEYTIEGKKIRYPNINRWRCFYGEQAHLDTKYLAPIDKMDEEGIYKAIDTVPTVDNHGYMCASFKHCMTPKQRSLERDYAPNPRRKKEKSEASLDEMLKKIKEIAADAGADCISIQPLSAFEENKKNFHQGFRTEQFFNKFKTVILYGRFIHAFDHENDPWQQRNWRHLRRSVIDRLDCATIDITRYLDDLGHEAIQDWYLTGIARQGAKNAHWEKEGKHIHLGAVITDVPFEPIFSQALQTWDENLSDSNSLKKLECLKEMELVTVGKTDGISYPGMKKVLEAYPFAKSIIALSQGIPQRVTELACNQEAECGAAYAFSHYESIKECFWAASDLCNILEKKGYKAVPLGDLAPESEMTINKFGRHMPDLRANGPYAVAAGLGALAKNGMAANEKLGVSMRYAFILTDASFSPISAEKALCPENCSLCAKACPTKALKAVLQKVEIRENESYEVMACDPLRCTWARSLAMSGKAGSDQLGWKLPDIELPKELTPETIEEIISQKDKIQTLAYRNPFFIDIIVERCLQACPLAKKK